MYVTVCVRVRAHAAYNADTLRDAHVTYIWSSLYKTYSDPEFEHTTEQ